MQTFTESLTSFLDAAWPIAAAAGLSLFGLAGC